MAITVTVPNSNSTVTDAFWICWSGMRRNIWNSGFVCNYSKLPWHLSLSRKRTKLSWSSGLLYISVRYIITEFLTCILFWHDTYCRNCFQIMVVFLNLDENSFSTPRQISVRVHLVLPLCRKIPRHPDGENERASTTSEADGMKIRKAVRPET